MDWFEGTQCPAGALFSDMLVWHAARAPDEGANRHPSGNELNATAFCRNCALPGPASLLAENPVVRLVLIGENWELETVWVRTMRHVVG